MQLPIQVICELLGIPQEDQADFRRWTGVLVAGSVDRSGVPAAAAQFLGYLRDLIAAKRAAPADDLLSALIATHATRATASTRTSSRRWCSCC